MQRKYVGDRLIDERYTDLERVDFDPAPAPGPQPASQSEPPRSAARHEAFVRLPVAWIDRLHGARGATWDVATHLLLRSFKEHRQTIRLANVALASIGITPKQKWRALAELEERGLVDIDRHPRRSPDVTLLYPREARK